MLSRVYRLAGPLPPLVSLLVDALLGQHARTADPEAAVLVGRAFRRASRRGIFGAIQSVGLLFPASPRTEVPRDW